VAKDSNPCGATGLFSTLPDQENKNPAQPMLVDQKMPAIPQTAVPGLGIPGRRALLVHQRHYLRMQLPGNLAKKDGYLPVMRSPEKSHNLNLSPPGDLTSEKVA
jgi:hypothetical protein